MTSVGRWTKRHFAEQSWDLYEAAAPACVDWTLILASRLCVHHRPNNYIDRETRRPSLQNVEQKTDLSYLSNTLLLSQKRFLLAVTFKPLCLFLCALSYNYLIELLQIFCDSIFPDRPALKYGAKLLYHGKIWSQKWQNDDACDNFISNSCVNWWTSSSASSLCGQQHQHVRHESNNDEKCLLGIRLLVVNHVTLPRDPDYRGLIFRDIAWHRNFPVIVAQCLRRFAPIGWT